MQSKREHQSFELENIIVVVSVGGRADILRNLSCVEFAFVPLQEKQKFLVSEKPAGRGRETNVNDRYRRRYVDSGP